MSPVKGPNNDYRDANNIARLHISVNCVLKC